jgi:hypothetical protein
MNNIPPSIIAPFKDLLIKKAIDKKYHNYYLKWLRYYFDFCTKYNYELPRSKLRGIKASITKIFAASCGVLDPKTE